MKEDEKKAVNMQPRGDLETMQKIREREHIFLIGKVSGINLAEIILRKDEDMPLKFWDLTFSFP